MLHPFAGASRSRRRARFIPASASAGRASRTSSQSGRRVRQQRPVCNHQRLSALSDLRKIIPRKAAAPLNPDRRPTAHRFPAGSFFGGFRTPALYPVDRSPGPASETLHDAGPLLDDGPEARSRAVCGLSRRQLRRSGFDPKGRSGAFTSTTKMPALLAYVAARHRLARDRRRCASPSSPIRPTVLRFSQSK